MNTNKSLATATITNIHLAIRDELLKRGFLAKTVIDEKTNRHGDYRLELSSEAFQTVPVLMKEIRINGDITLRQNAENDNVIDIGGRVGVRYDHFTGGSNGCELFSIFCKIRKDREDIYEVTVR
jgi:hypothetical protein